MTEERHVVALDLGGTPAVDLELLDALARLRVVLRRHGGTLRLTGACAEVRGLLALAGLDDALGLELRGQAEALEQPGVEEVVDVGDLPA